MVKAGQPSGLREKGSNAAIGQRENAQVMHNTGTQIDASDGGHKPSYNAEWSQNEAKSTLYVNLRSVKIVLFMC